MERDVKLQASFHGIDLSGTGTQTEEKGDGEKPLPLTPEQEAAIARRLEETQARLKKRFSKDG